MDQFEYKVVPAPTKGRKARGVRRPEDKFALSVEEVMNEMASAGWEYQRSETLPHEERAGLTGTSTTFRSILVFRRVKTVADETQSDEQQTVAIESETPLPQIEDHSSEDVEDHEPASEEPSSDEIDTDDMETTKDSGMFSAETFRDQKLDPRSLPAALRQRASRKRRKKGVPAE